MQRSGSLDFYQHPAMYWIRYGRFPWRHQPARQTKLASPKTASPRSPPPPSCVPAALLIGCRCAVFCRLHAAAVSSLCLVPHLLLFFFLLICLFVFWGGFYPSWMLCHCTATSQRISHFLLSFWSISSSRLLVSRCLSHNKVRKCFSDGCFFSVFSVRMLPPPERSLFPVLTLSLCPWMSCSSPGCLPLTPTTNHQLLLHTADSWRAKRCLTSSSDICTALTFTTGGSESFNLNVVHVGVKCHRSSTFQQ